MFSYDEVDQEYVQRKVFKPLHKKYDFISNLIFVNFVKQDAMKIN